MEFLNNYTCRINNSCDLIGMLGGFLACALSMNQNCRPEFISGPIQRGIDTFNVNQFLNKTYKFCHCEQSEAIHFKQYDAICHYEELCDEAIHKTNCKKYCRPEFISGPIQCGAEKLNLKDKFFTLLAGKMLNQVQHDMFFCHCEQSEAIHFKQYGTICHCEELCDEAIY